MAPPQGSALPERLLRTMAEGPVHSISALAQELDVSEEMVSRMIKELVRLGYLRSIGARRCGRMCRLSSGRELRRRGRATGLAADSARKMGGGEGSVMSRWW